MIRFYPTLILLLTSFAPLTASNKAVQLGAPLSKQNAIIRGASFIDRKFNALTRFQKNIVRAGFVTLAIGVTYRTLSDLILSHELTKQRLLQERQHLHAQRHLPKKLYTTQPLPQLTENLQTVLDDKGFASCKKIEDEELKYLTTTLDDKTCKPVLHIEMLLKQAYTQKSLSNPDTVVAETAHRTSSITLPLNLLSQLPNFKEKTLLEAIKVLVEKIGQNISDRQSPPRSFSASPQHLNCAAALLPEDFVENLNKFGAKEISTTTDIPVATPIGDRRPSAGVAWITKKDIAAVRVTLQVTNITDIAPEIMWRPLLHFQNTSNK